MENYFIIYDSFGSPFGNWFSWLHDFITEDGKQVYVPGLLKNLSKLKEKIETK